MATSSQPEASRLVGRIVDPLAEGDPSGEPRVELTATAETEQSSSTADSARPADEGEPRAATIAANDASSEQLETALADPPSADPPSTAEAASTQEPASTALAGSATPTVSETSSEADSALRAAATQAPAPTTPSSSTADAASTALAEADDDASRGHPVRERLLAKARAAREAAGLAELEPVAPSRDPRGSELDRVASPSMRPPSAPVVPGGKGQLSPNMIALFGTLLGLATVASLVALAMNLKTPIEAQPVPEASAQAEAEAEEPPNTGTVLKPKRQKIPGPWRVDDAASETGMRIIEGTIGTRAFLRAVQDDGLEKSQAYRVLTALKDLKDLDRCERDDRFKALVERSSQRVTAFEYIDNKENVYQAKEGKDGYLKGKKLDLKVERGQVRGALVYTGKDFSAAAQRAGFDKGIGKVLDKAFDGHTAIEELDRGDRIRIIAQEVTVLGEFSRYAGIEAVEIVYANPKSEPLRIYYFHHPKVGGYYDKRGRAPYEGGWRKPIKDAPITSRFNPKRMHPVLKKVMPHTGTDFGAPTGTPVGASSYGTVSFVGPAGASGNLVKIDHPGGIETGYAHLSRFAEGLKVGDRVKRLQVIGYVGSTGRSTGPHLHFTAKKNGEFFDAEKLNLDGMRVLGKEYRDTFAEVRRKYDTLLEALPLPEPLPKAAEPALAAVTQDEDEGLDLVAETSDRSSNATATMAAPAQKPKAPGPPAKAQGASAIYLTDEELLKMQSVTDDGEVAP